MTRKILILLFGLLILTPIFAVENRLSAMDKCALQSTQWIQTYYSSPTPDQFPAMMNSANRCKIFDAEMRHEKEPTNYIPPTAYFAARLFADNQKKISAWMKKINFTSKAQRLVLFTGLWESDTEEGSRYLLLAAGSSNPEIAVLAKKVMAKPRTDLMTAVITSDTLDNLWASFFATGQQKYIERIVSVLSWSNLFVENAPSSKKHINKMLTYMSAQWSIRSISHQDPNVLKILNKILPTLNETAQTSLKKLLFENHAAFKKMLADEKTMLFQLMDKHFHKKTER